MSNDLNIELIVIIHTLVWLLKFQLRTIGPMVYRRVSVQKNDGGKVREELRY